VASTLLDLNLSGNNIGPRGAVYLGEALTKSMTLATLKLRSCEIEDNGAIALGTALRTNRSLDLLDIAKNEISDAGVKALIDAVYAQQNRNIGAWKQQKKKDAETMFKKRLISTLTAPLHSAKRGLISCLRRRKSSGDGGEMSRSSDGLTECAEANSPRDSFSDALPVEGLKKLSLSCNPFGEDHLATFFEEQECTSLTKLHIRPTQEIPYWRQVRFWRAACGSVNLVEIKGEHDDRPRFSTSPRPATFDD